MEPLVPVKYCVQPLGARFLLLHSIWVTLIAKALVAAVLALPKLAFKVLQFGSASTYMCSPVLVPQMTGGAIYGDIQNWTSHCFNVTFSSWISYWKRVSVTLTKAVSRPCCRGCAWAYCHGGDCHRIVKSKCLKIQSEGEINKNNV